MVFYKFSNNVGLFQMLKRKTQLQARFQRRSGKVVYWDFIRITRNKILAKDFRLARWDL